ncbi:MAG: DnaA ATPase domain-containing protein, partial [Gammaproteobacteria bacterium]
MSLVIWDQCLNLLQDELTVQQFNTWIRPLHANQREGKLVLLAPNRFVCDWIHEHFYKRINEVLIQVSNGAPIEVLIEIGSRRDTDTVHVGSVVNVSNATTSGITITKDIPLFQSNLNPNFTFDNFVEGKSNQLALAAAKQVGMEPGGTNNPLLIYGGVGLGKTHLMHAVGNMILQHNPHAKVLYLHSERFVAEMVKALQTNRMNDFKMFYRQVDALLIDDIQFFAGKDRSQEEFFHTFNALLEGR